MFNNTSMAKGKFYKPEAVLDNVAMSPPTEHGVIDISARDVSGRILISNNSVIVGGVVDKTGETGVAAVCKLLLLPYGNYAFRRAHPIDKVQLQQELNLHAQDAIKFLSGPSSIGLSRPAYHEQALSNVEEKSELFGWETTNFRANYQEDGTPEYVRVEGQDDVLSDTYIEECNRILEIQRKVEAYVLSQQTAKANPEVVLQAGPLPSRKHHGKGIKPAWILAAASVVIGLGIFSVMNKPGSNSYFQEAMVTSTETVSQPETPQETQASNTSAAPEAPAATGNAPFALPSESAKADPPPNTPASEPEAQPEEPTPVAAPATPAPPTASPNSNQEVIKWMDAVRKDPRDVQARKELSFAYLVAGDPNSSIAQFYEAMKIQRMDSSDIITYANNLMAFGGKDRARQFLADVLRTDPGQSAIRERLNSMR